MVPKRVGRAALIFLLFKTVHLAGAIDGVPVPVAARSETWVCGSSLAGGCGFEYRRKHGCVYLVSVVCCQVEGFATS